ncbi:MAG TPA: DUF3060 domain-containing protein [Nakamurella sp.]
MQHKPARLGARRGRRTGMAAACAILMLGGCSGTPDIATVIDPPPTASPWVGSGAPAAPAATAPAPGTFYTTVPASPTTVGVTESSPAPPSSDIEDLVPVTGDEIYVNQSLVRRTIECADKAIVINGSLNQITFTGSCSSTLTNGSLNHLAFDQVASITLNGANNQVTWKGGGANAAPSVKDRGFGNRVDQG